MTLKSTQSSIRRGFCFQLFCNKKSYLGKVKLFYIGKDKINVSECEN